jgi:hypothetical protein
VFSPVTPHSVCPLDSEELLFSYRMKGPTSSSESSPVRKVGIVALRRGSLMGRLLVGFSDWSRRKFLEWPMSACSSQREYTHHLLILSAM